MAIATEPLAREPFDRTKLLVLPAALFIMRRLLWGSPGLLGG